MPNWCINKLNIVAPSKEKMAEVAEAIRSDEEPLSFEKISPMPESLKGTTSPSRNGSDVSVADSMTRITEVLNGTVKDYNDWYEFNLGEWGTKWDVKAVMVESGTPDNQMTMEFQTAWSPPNKILEKLMDRFPDVDFELYYLEPGMEFAGVHDREGDSCYSGGEDYKKISREQFGYDFECEED